MPLTIESAQRLKTFLTALRARLILQELHFELTGQSPSPGLVPDDLLDASLQLHTLLLDTLAYVADEPSLAPLAPLVSRALLSSSDASKLLDGLA